MRRVGKSSLLYELLHQRHPKTNAVTMHHILTDPAAISLASDSKTFACSRRSAWEQEASSRTLVAVTGGQACERFQTYRGLHALDRICLGCGYGRFGVGGSRNFLVDGVRAGRELHPGIFGGDLCPRLGGHGGISNGAALEGIRDVIDFITRRRDGIRRRVGCTCLDIVDIYWASGARDGSQAGLYRGWECPCQASQGESVGIIDDGAPCCSGNELEKICILVICSPTRGQGDSNGAGVSKVAGLHQSGQLDLRLRCE